MSKKYIATLIFGALLPVSLVFAAMPDIETYNNPNGGQTVVITSPSGYKSQIISSYDGSQFHTVATSTPLTDEDMKALDTQFALQEKITQQIFSWQNNLFEEQEKMFQDLWSSF